MGNKEIQSLLSGLSRVLFSSGMTASAVLGGCMNNPTSTTSSSSSETTTGKIPHAPIILAVLTGQDVTREEFAQVAYAFVRSSRESGPKLLTREALERARDIAGNEKVSDELRQTNTKILSAHAGALAALVDLHHAAFITILSAPIGASKDHHPEVKEAYRELGVLTDRFFTRKALPGLARKEEDRSKILTGLASDVYSLIKNNPEFASLKEASEKRFNEAKDRISQLQAEFDARFPYKAVLQRVRMIGLIADYQTDPDSLTPVEKKVLVTKEGKPIFKNGRLTQEAKDRLNVLQDEEGNPEWLVRQIRAVFARDGESGRIEHIKQDVGSGL